MIKQGVKVITTENKKFKGVIHESEKLEILINETITELNNNNCKVTSISCTTIGGARVPITATIIFEFLV